MYQSREHPEHGVTGTTLPRDDKTSEYFEPRHPASYSGAWTFARHTDSTGNELVKILNHYPAYTRHRPIRRRFPRNKIITGGIDHVWFVDLADVSNLRTYNNNIRFLLCVVDAFSKKAFVEPLPNKRTSTVRAGFERIFERTERRPRQIFSDAGTEFTGNDIQNLFIGHRIRHIRAYNTETKASIAEIFLKNFKRKIYRYLTHNRTKRYLPVLRDFEDSYNQTYNRAIGTTPDLVDKSNEANIWHRLYHSSAPPEDKPKFQAGDFVRLAELKGAFGKTFTGAWTNEVFRLASVKPGFPRKYVVEALDGEKIIGTFNPYELLKITFDENRFIPETILKTTTSKGGRKRYLVRWRDRPPSFDSWTTNKNVRQ